MDDVDVVTLSPLLYMGILVREELQRRFDGVESPLYKLSF